MDRYKGKTAIITGGSRGLGRGFAERLGSEGARVLITGRTQADLYKAVAELEAIDIECVAVLGDIAEHAVHELIAETAMERWGRIDLLVNNAGFDDEAPFLEIKRENWDYLLNVMLTAPFALSQVCGREMVKAGRGSIVNVTSILGHCADGQFASYGTAKSGLIGLTKWIATELAPKGVRCNSLSPGYVSTPLIEESYGPRLFNQMQTDLRRVPIRRMLTVEEVASACAYLGSDEASGVTGTDFVIDGGTLADGYIVAVVEEMAAAAEAEAAGD